MLDSPEPLVCKLCESEIEAVEVEAPVAICPKCGNMNAIDRVSRATPSQLQPDKALRVAKKKIQRKIANELDKAFRKAAKNSKGMLTYKSNKRR